MSTTTTLATPGPVIVEGIVDLFELPMPAKIKEQALHCAQSLVRGEPNRAKIALTVLAGKGAGLRRDDIRREPGTDPGVLRASSGARGGCPRLSA